MKKVLTLLWAFFSLHSPFASAEKVKCEFVSSFKPHLISGKEVYFTVAAGGETLFDTHANYQYLEFTMQQLVMSVERLRNDGLCDYKDEDLLTALTNTGLVKQASKAMSHSIEANRNRSLTWVTFTEFETPTPSISVNIDSHDSRSFKFSSFVRSGFTKFPADKNLSSYANPIQLNKKYYSGVSQV